MGYVLLIETQSPADVALIKSVLDAEGIHYLAHGEQFSMLRQMVEPVRFMVPEEELDAARDLLVGISFKYAPLAGLMDKDDASADEPAQ
jgi:hypothetical protein